MKTFTVCDGPLSHDGKEHATGSSVQLDEAAAAVLYAAGVVQPAEPAAKAGKATKAAPAAD